MSENLVEDTAMPLSIPVGFLIELSETNDRQDVLAAFARWVKLILDCGRISILMPGEANTLERILVEENQIVLTGEHTPLYGTTLGELFRKHRSGIFPDLTLLDTPDAKHVVSRGLVAGVVAPVTFGGRCLGLLVATYFEKKDTLDEDLLLLESMGRCLASYMLLHDQLLELSEMALTDALTKLHNRRSFQTISSQAIERWEKQAEQFSLLICDLDHFKRLNDAHGHDFGDEVLRAVAEAMKEISREKDYVVRMGGEEFCILMTNTCLEDAIVLGEAVRKNVSALKLNCDGKHVEVTISVGVATMTTELGSVRDLVIAADQALYEAKQSGRNRVVQAAA